MATTSDEDTLGLLTLARAPLSSAPVVRKGVCRFPDGRWLVWHMTCSSEVYCFIFTHDGEPVEPHNSNERQRPLRRLLAAQGRMVSTPATASPEKLLAAQKRLVGAIRSKLLPPANAALREWFATLTGPGNAGLELRVSCEHNGGALILEMRGPTNIVRRDGRLGLYDASVVRARLYSAARPPAADGKTGAPADGKTGAPADGKAGAPTDGKASAPAAPKAGATGGAKKAAPAAPEAGAADSASAETDELVEPVEILLDPLRQVPGLQDRWASEGFDAPREKQLCILIAVSMFGIFEPKIEATLY